MVMEPVKIKVLILNLHFNYEKDKTTLRSYVIRRKYRIFQSNIKSKRI